MSLYPYLYFTGTCRQAMTCYHEVLVGHLEGLTSADLPAGEVTMPLGETFWSPRFGTCTDRFGTSWIVNVDAIEEVRV